MTDRSWPPWPAPIRARARGCRRQLLDLRRRILDLFPDAEAVANDPSYAERFNTTVYDLEGAEILAALRPLLWALDDVVDASSGSR